MRENEQDPEDTFEQGFLGRSSEGLASGAENPGDADLFDDPLDAGIAAFFGGSSNGTQQDLEVGAAPKTTIGDYRIIREIGHGAMGDVYLAEQISLRRRVALKLLPASMTRRLDAVTRFRIEASSAARLRHPGIVNVYAIGECEGQHYIAMELIEGSPLHEVIAQLRTEGLPGLDGSRVGHAVTSAAHKVSKDSVLEVAKDSPEYHLRQHTDHGLSRGWSRSYIETVCRLTAQVADALQHAHDAGVIHRDVKPSNILVREDGTAVLTDFGLARAEDLPSVTQSQVYVGTPHYSSPEQARAKKQQIDHRTDIFSLGVTLYELLTLRLPFDGKTSIEVLEKIVEREVPNPRRLNRKLPRDLVTILLKALQKDPRNRYPNAGAFAADLRAFLAMEPIAARRASVGAKATKFVRRHRVASVVALILAGFGAWWWTRPGNLPRDPRLAPVVILDGRRSGNERLSRLDDLREREEARVQLIKNDGEIRRLLDTLDHAPDREQLQAARTALNRIDELAGTKTPGTNLSLLAIAKANRHLQRIIDTLLVKRAIALVQEFIAPNASESDSTIPKQFKELLLFLEQDVARTLAEVSPDDTDRHKRLKENIENFKELRDLIGLLGKARVAEFERNAGVLRSLVRSMEDINRKSALTRHAARLLRGLITTQDQIWQDARDEFQARSPSRFALVLERLKEQRELGQEDLDGLLNAHQWLEKLVDKWNGIRPTLSDKEFGRLQVPDVDTLPERLQDAGRLHAKALLERTKNMRKLRDARKACSRVELACRDRDLATAEAQLQELEAFAPSALGLDIEATKGLVERLKDEEYQWKDAESRYEEFRENLAGGDAETLDEALGKLKEDWRKIRTWLGSALETSPRREELLLRRSQVNLRLGNYEEVLRDADELLRQEESPEGLMLRGQANHALSRFEAAEIDFTAAIAHSNNNAARAYFWRGACRYMRAQRSDQKMEKMGLAEEALKDLDAARLKLDTVDVNHLMAMLHLMLHPEEGTKDAINAAKAAVSKFSLGYVFSEDEILTALGKHTKGIAARVKVFRRDVLYVYGEAYRQNGSYKRSIDEYNKALKLDSNFALAYYTRGAAHFELKEYEHAIDSLDKAVQHSIPASKLRIRAEALLDAYKKYIRK